MHITLKDKKTSDAIFVSIATDGSKNTVLLVTGEIKSEEDSTFDIIDIKKLSGKPTSLRLDGTVFMVESGLKVLLKYRDKPFVLPLEGRSKVDLEWISGLVGHEIDLVFKGVGSFFIVLDISKVGV